MDNSNFEQQFVKAHLKFKNNERDNGRSVLNLAGISEMDANTEEISGRITAGMSVPRKSGYLSTAAKSEASTQTVAMDMWSLRQIFLRRETSRRSLR